MDYKKIFRSAAENGFHQEDVIRYMDEMEKSTKNTEAQLKDQIDLLVQSRNELSQEVSEFSSQVKGLEQQLMEEKSRVQQVSSMRDYLYTELEHKQKELDEEVKARQDDLAACKREIEQYLSQKKELQEQIEELSIKNQKYDELQGNLKRIRMKAESEAFEMLETAKEQSMDAISVVDDVVGEISLFQKDIKHVKEDLFIGPETAADRLDALYDTLEQYASQLIGIKERFYKAHSLADENSYDYMNIAPTPAIGETKCAEAEEILPSGGGAENILPIEKSSKSIPKDQRKTQKSKQPCVEEAAEEQ